MNHHSIDRSEAVHSGRVISALAEYISASSDRPVDISTYTQVLGTAADLGLFRARDFVFNQAGSLQHRLADHCCLDPGCDGTVCPLLGLPTAIEIEPLSALWQHDDSLAYAARIEQSIQTLEDLDDPGAWRAITNLQEKLRALRAEIDGAS